MYNGEEWRAPCLESIELDAEMATILETKPSPLFLLVCHWPMREPSQNQRVRSEISILKG